MQCRIFQLNCSNPILPILILLYFFILPICSFFCMVFGSIHHSCTINWLAIDTGAWFALKESALDCMDGSDNQARTRATLSSKENRERKTEDERYLWRIARWNDGPNSSSFQELYITLVCPLRLLSVTLLQRSTEKNYVPRNATRFATRGAKYNLVSFDKFLHFRDK